MGEPKSKKCCIFVLGFVIADMKRVGEKLEKAHPDSESIKYGFTIALMEA